MDAKKIYAKEEHLYLDDFLDELPTNCLFNKGITGCGGTTLAIRSKKDTIIVMPYVSVIKNKIIQHTQDNLLGIYGDTTNNKIIEYVRNSREHKILVTYDSLERLIKLLIEERIDVYNRYFLLVDEWHILFNSYAFRNKAIKNVLTYSRLFNEVTFMTATPIEEEFILEEIKDFPIVEVIWKNIEKVKVNQVQSKRPLITVSQIIKQKMEDKIFGNLHFFVNSVEFISEVIKDTSLLPHQVRVVCSNSPSQGRGIKSNQAKLGSDFLIEETTSQPKQINFYTSTCFEGCDIYDEEGKTFIVSDKRKAHSLLDISTLIIQICGRIRDSKYKFSMTHIYTSTRYNIHSSYEEFKKQTDKNLTDSIKWITDINCMPKDSREKTISIFLRNKNNGINEKYVYNNDGVLEIDLNLLKHDRANYKISKHLYLNMSILSEEYNKYGFEIGKCQIHRVSDKLKENPKARVSFKDLFIEYVALKSAENKDSLLFYSFGNYADRQTLIENQNPLVKEAYEKLGVARIEEMKYRVGNIKREIYNLQTDISIDRKIIRCLQDMQITEGCIKTAKDLKTVLQGIYTSLNYMNINGTIQKAKATDLNKWFNIKKRTPKIKGKTTDCYEIVSEKILYE